jgi:hypothetical protein
MSTEISAAIRTCTDDCPRTVKKLWVGVEESAVSSRIATSQFIPDCVVDSTHPSQDEKSQFLCTVFGNAHAYLRPRPDSHDFQTKSSVRPRSAADVSRPNWAAMTCFGDQYRSSIGRGV